MSGEFDLNKMENNMTSRDLEDILNFQHEMIEIGFFNFIDNELNAVFDQQQPQHQLSLQSTGLQITEAFAFLIVQFLNENLQKWIMMENASLDAKDQVETSKYFIIFISYLFLINFFFF